MNEQKDYVYKQKIVKPGLGFIDDDEVNGRKLTVVNEEVHYLVNGRDCRNREVAETFLVDELKYSRADAKSFLDSLPIRVEQDRRIPYDGETDYWKEHNDYIAYQLRSSAERVSLTRESEQTSINPEKRQ